MLLADPKGQAGFLSFCIISENARAICTWLIKKAAIYIKEWCTLQVETINSLAN